MGPDKTIAQQRGAIQFVHAKNAIDMDACGYVHKQQRITTMRQGMCQRAGDVLDITTAGK